MSLYFIGGEDRSGAPGMKPATESTAPNGRVWASVLPVVGWIWQAAYPLTDSRTGASGVTAPDGSSNTASSRLPQVGTKSGSPGGGATCHDRIARTLGCTAPSEHALRCA